MRLVALCGGAGRLEDDGTVAVLDVPASLGTLLAAGEASQAIGGRRVRERSTLEALSLSLPLSPSATVFGVGMNYGSKQAATGRTRPEHPVWFVKCSSSMAGPGEPVMLPRSASSAVDYEGELTVVLGAPLFEATPSEAAAAIAAVGVANDVTARDVLRETGNPTIAKSYPSFGQLGSFVLDARTYGGIGQLTISTTVNGAQRQFDRGKGMLLDPVELLVLLSQHLLLRPGDVLMTGTPAGTGDETGSYLARGDVVAVTVGDLPPLRSLVTSAAPAAVNLDGLEAGAGSGRT